jgi:hypothetical protein
VLADVCLSHVRPSDGSGEDIGPRVFLVVRSGLINPSAQSAVEDHCDARFVVRGTRRCGNVDGAGVERSGSTV